MKEAIENGPWSRLSLAASKLDNKPSSQVPRARHRIRSIALSGNQQDVVDAKKVFLVKWMHTCHADRQ